MSTKAESQSFKGQCHLRWAEGYEAQTPNNGRTYNITIFVGSVHTFLHINLNMSKVAAGLALRMLAQNQKGNASMWHYDGLCFHSPTYHMDETWITLLNMETKRQSAKC